MMRRTLIVAALAASTVVVAGCAGTATTAPTPTSTITSPAAAAPGSSVTDAQAQKLCSDISAQFSTWRVQGPTIGRAGFNILVQQWAAESGTINLSVLTNRAQIDELTTRTCADVRTTAVDLLAVPDLASALVGVG